MKADIRIKRWNLLLLFALRLVLVGFVLAVLIGIKFPFMSGDKSNLIILIHIGVLVGIVSNWRFIIGLKWNDPINIIGSLFGVFAALVIIFATKNMNVLFITNYSTAFQVLGVLLIVKIGLKMIQDRKDRIPISKT
jgi:hypothetical protein